MLKPLLLAGAMLLSAPALAQVNASAGAPPTGDNPNTEQADKKMPEPTMGGSEGTTASHAISSATDGVEETDKEPSLQAGSVSASAAASRTSSAYSGVGGPGGDLMEVAGEMLGDPARVDKVMRDRDSNMKASDLLNAAMLTLIQSGGKTPR